MLRLRVVTLSILALSLCESARCIAQTALSGAPNHAHPARASDEAADHVIQTLGAAFVQADKTDALSIVLLRNGLAHFYNFGSVLPGQQQAPTSKSVYEIGSVTKLLTSLLLAHAIVDHRIDPHADIRRYLPGNYPNLLFAGQPIRILDLADTTSALPDNLPDFSRILASVDEASAPATLAHALNAYTQADLLRDLHTVSLVGPPGVTPRHSNLAAELLGLIVARIYSTPYDRLLSRTIEQPLGMGDGVNNLRAALLVPGFSAQHGRMPVTNQPAVMAAGGLRFSPEDMSHFLRAELAASDPAIRLTQQPAWSSPETAAIGFNWNLTRSTEGDLRLQTSGGTFGSASHIELFPALGYGIVLLANRPGETESALGDLAGQIISSVEGTPALDSLRRALEAADYKQVGKVVAVVEQQYPNLHLTELFLNNWAGGLLASNPQSALSLFQFNTERWPRSSDAWDSLGDGYAAVHDKPRAAAAYRTALALNPANGEAKESLRVLNP